MAPLVPLALPAVASPPPEPSSDLLWVDLGGSQSSTVVPAQHVLDSKDKAKNLRWFFLIKFRPCTFSWYQEQIDSNISPKFFRKPSPRKIFKNHSDEKLMPSCLLAFLDGDRIPF